LNLVIKEIFIHIAIIEFMALDIQSDSFIAQGSELLMGVGAKDIARSGASVARTSDIYSIFWNPAGLSEIKSGEMGLSSQMDGSLTPINFFGLAYAVAIEKLGVKVAVAFAYIPRLYMEASGKYYEDDFESIFLRYTLPGLSGNFDGTIHSKTDEFKLAVALTPIRNPFWSIGASAGYVNCATTFAGVTMEDPSNFQNISTVATSISYGLGAKIYASDTLTFGVNVKNLDAELAVAVDRVDDSGYAQKSYDVAFPLDITAGVDWEYSDDLDLAMDFQRVFGTYGDYTIDFQVLRFGSTFSQDTLDYHLGFIAPLKLESSKVHNIELKSPIAPTAGLGWHNSYIDLSFAFYFHPIMTLHEGKPSPSLDLSVAYTF
jgi:hypothetical protein